jgi:hypothetical protein
MVRGLGGVTQDALWPPSLMAKKLKGDARQHTISRGKTAVVLEDDCVQDPNVVHTCWVIDCYREWQLQRWQIQDTLATTLTQHQYHLFWVTPRVWAGRPADWAIFNRDRTGLTDNINMIEHKPSSLLLLLFQPWQLLHKLHLPYRILKKSWVCWYL